MSESESPRPAHRPRTYEDQDGQGAPRMTLRLEPDLMGWVKERGGPSFVREMLVAAQGKQASPSPVTVFITLDADLHAQLRASAYDKECSVADRAREAIVESLRQEAAP